ncbi:MAG: DUF2795 domain-containing protein [Pseudonocardiaceae bacterium]|nr:DUF2795 domain-containing protein [Pseudonocardiaceae bacterium]
MSTDRESLKASLSALDFPVSKEALVEYAEKHGADQDTVRALRAAPLGDYQNVSEVLGSVPLDEGQSSSDKARQRRLNTKDGLAEQHTETPSNPIVEELGENRGS